MKHGAHTLFFLHLIIFTSLFGMIGQGLLV